MAQWHGQYSGMTHQRAINDAEELLKHAVEVVHACTDDPTRRKKEKNVRGLAKRVFSARRHPLKADMQAEAGLRRETSNTAAEKLRRFDEAGVAGILEEFGASELMGD